VIALCQLRKSLSRVGCVAVKSKNLMGERLWRSSRLARSTVAPAPPSILPFPVGAERRAWKENDLFWYDAKVKTLGEDFDSKLISVGNRGKTGRGWQSRVIPNVLVERAETS
jgi:hypothetical protein